MLNTSFWLLLFLLTRWARVQYIKCITSLQNLSSVSLSHIAVSHTERQDAELATVYLGSPFPTIRFYILAFTITSVADLHLTSSALHFEIYMATF